MDRSHLVARGAAPALTLAFALAAATVSASSAAETGFGTPGAALVMPYDSTAGHVTFLAAQNTRATAVATHWTFWGEDCSLRAQAEICLTPDDSVVVDPTRLVSVDAENRPVGGAVADLSGSRGFATVTALEADAECRRLRGGRHRILDGALTGAYSIAELEQNSAFGSSAIVLRAAGGIVELPDRRLESLDLYTWNPDTLTKTQVIVLGLRESAGELPGEVGPLGSGGGDRVQASLSYVDTLEVAHALPDVDVGCAFFGDARTLVAPAGADSSGFFRLADFSERLGGGAAGTRAFLFGLHGFAFHGFAQMQNGIYRFSEQ